MLPAWTWEIMKMLTEASRSSSESSLNTYILFSKYTPSWILPFLSSIWLQQSIRHCLISCREVDQSHTSYGLKPAHALSISFNFGSMVRISIPPAHCSVSVLPELRWHQSREYTFFFKYLNILMIKSNLRMFLDFKNNCFGLYNYKKQLHSFLCRILDMQISNMTIWYHICS